MSVELILASPRGSIVAPAGCGKTQLIADTISVDTHKPYLVLTHTTAGVAALKKRLSGIPTNRYRVTTIAGWALNVARMFPILTGYTPPADGSPDYPILQNAVANLCIRGDLHETLIATYSRVFVDEYQDCDQAQHRIITGLSQFIPTVIFGDPMQMVFNFRNAAMPDWNGEVTQIFPVVAQLGTPWRWNNANSPDFGQWILNCRHQLWTGNKINLQGCPNHVFWHQITNNLRQEQIAIQYQIRQNMGEHETFLIIGDPANRNSRHEFAKNTNGIGVVEPVELQDIIGCTGHLDNSRGVLLLEQVTSALSEMVVGVDRSNLIQRINTILNGRNRNAPSEYEQSAVEVVRSGSKDSILAFLSKLEEKNDTRIFRQDAYHILKKSIEISNFDPSKSITQAAIMLREQRRHSGDKRIPHRAIGSTLLLKGLEADHVLILNADNMNPMHLYVALSRGARTVHVFSTNPVVG